MDSPTSASSPSASTAPVSERSVAVEQQPSAKKRRIPKACAACRNSKLKCDGGKPCLRCREKNTWCDYVKPVTNNGTSNDVVVEKLARLEAEISSLRSAQSHPESQASPSIQTHLSTVPESTRNPNHTTTAMALLQMQAQTPNTTPPPHSYSRPNTQDYQHAQPQVQPNTANLTSHELYQHFRDMHPGPILNSPPTDVSVSRNDHYPMQDAGANQNPNPNAFSSLQHNHSHNQTQHQLPPPTFNSRAFQIPQAHALPSPDSGSIARGEAAVPPMKKRKRGEFELNTDVPGDVVSRGLISFQDAELYFKTFFEGCDRYVPVFDPKYDTFDSVRARSSMLFDVICAVGCRAEHGPNAPPSHPFLQTTKSPLCAAILGTAPRNIETIQALLIEACYSEKGWLLTSMALKMALELDLPDSYRKLSGLVLSSGGRGGGGSQSASGVGGSSSNYGLQLDDGPGGLEMRAVDRREIAIPDEEEEKLMRESRVWFGVWVLEHILSIDCGKNPGVRATSGEAMRRCRVLLRYPARTALDFRLLAQVELNSIRALAHEKLLPISRQDGGLSDDEMSEIVQGTRIDLSVWLSDWENLVDSHIQNPEERASLVVNLRIQRDWSEMTMLCKGLQGMGIENVAIMTDPQRDLIHLAKNSAKRHLATILSQPDVYLATFQYSMDFVWAKCAFSVLLLLKLARIVPDASPQNEMSSLITDAKILLSHLAKVRGSSNIYTRILALSVEKCEKALNSDGMSAGSLGIQSSGIDGDDGGDGVDPEMDFQSYVPREFTLEWNFPGLTFCWIPCDWMDLFGDFGTGF